MREFNNVIASVESKFERGLLTKANVGELVLRACNDAVNIIFKERKTGDVEELIDFSHVVQVVAFKHKDNMDFQLFYELVGYLSGLRDTLCMQLLEELEEPFKTINMEVF